MADGDFGGFDDAEDALEPYQPTPLRASFAAGRTEGLPRGASQPRQFERGGGQRDDADWDDVPRYGNSQRQRGQNGDYGGYGGDPRATQGRQLAPPEGPRATPRPGPSQPMRQGYDDPQMNMRNGFDGRGQEAFQPSPHRTPNGAFLPEVRRGPPREDTLRFLEHWQQNPQSVDRRASFRGGATGSRNSSKRQSHVGTDRFDHYSSEDERPRAARAGTRGRGGGGNRNSRETPMSRRDQARYEPDLLELAYGPGPGPLRTPAQHYVQRPRPSGAPGNQGAAMAHQFPTPASKKEPSNDIYDVLYVAQVRGLDALHERSPLMRPNPTDVPAYKTQEVAERHLQALSGRRKDGAVRRARKSSRDGLLSQGHLRRHESRPRKILR